MKHPILAIILLVAFIYGLYRYYKWGLKETRWLIENFPRR